MKSLLKMENQMFCKFHFFPKLKLSRVQLSFTKFTVVTKKQNQKVVFKCPNFPHLEKKLQKNQILYAVSFFLTLPLGCISCLLVRATSNEHSIKCFPTITWVKQASSNSF